MTPEDQDTPNDFIHEVTRYQSAIAAYIRSLLPTHPDYMDILQEVNVTLWKKRDKYQPNGQRPMYHLCHLKTACTAPHF